MTKFWKLKPLSKLSKDEWESLCDGCGLCCLNKFIDPDTKEILYTMVACHLFDDNKCRCTDYKNRKQIVPNCLNLFHSRGWAKFMPKSCAYRLLKEGKELPDWHYLISKDKNLVHKLGISAKRRTISEKGVLAEDMPNYVIFKA